ncbi:nucleotide-binding protein (plasmid) [Rhodococcus oxybenzonivorans]|uniref:Nucleotide-binding protein n=1 Tax=Rhodococcus oxybenzonivorans TaxID=1990687 RepID=A0A2S2C6R8_9NOCA|nr:OB-fold domain-containing protein [Rhodococcus oxybenzonivorans]AWK76504.1 nucleotide-binding protein [Rhodococcus oxybenzonivorans]
MSTTELPSPKPEIQPETASFWAATLEGKLLLQRCSDCGRAGYYPRFVCANCHSTGLDDFEATGRGTIYSYTVTTRGILEYATAGSYVLAMVALDEGPKMITNIVECEPADLHIGQTVEVVFAATGGAGALPRFRPVIRDV